MKLINFIYFFYLQFYFSFSQNYLHFLSNYEKCYSITIKIEPSTWRVFLDSINDYFILYDNKESYHPWAKSIITKSKNLIKRKETKINNYGNIISAIEYSSPLKFKTYSYELNKFHFFYTKEKCQDRRMWNTIEPNIRQLSLGIGLNIKDTNYSFIHTLYDNNIITNKVFSFEHIVNENKRKSIYINIGEIEPGLKTKYQYSFVSTIPFTQQHWSIYIHSIKIGNKHFPIKSYATINTGIQESIRSYVIYQMFRDFFMGHPVYKHKCKENNMKENIITIKCDDIEKNQMNEEVKFVVSEGIDYAISIKNFLVWEDSSCNLQMIYFDTQNKEYELQVGKGFLEIFDLVEFNFDQRKIAYYSNDIIFNVIRINSINKFLIILFIWIMIICDLCLLVYTKIKFINYSGNIIKFEFYK